MNYRRKFYQLIFLIFVTISFYCLLNFFLYQYDNKYTHKEIQPVNGILCLTDEKLLTNNVYFLTREWQYYPNVFFLSDDLRNKTPDTYMRFLTIGKYRNFSMGNFYNNPNGSATYRLIIFLPEKSHTYSLSLPEIFSSYRLYINDDLVLQLGNPDKKNYKTSIGNRTVTFTASGKTELIFHVSNYTHYLSGITFSPAFGYPEKITSINNIKLFVRITILTILLIIGLCSLFFSIKLKQKIAWLFTLLCISTVGYTIYPIVFTFFTLHVQPYYTIELFTTYIMYLLMIILQNYVLNTNFKFQKIIYTIFTVFYFTVFLYGIAPVHNQMMHYFFYIFVNSIQLLVATYLFINAIYAILFKENYSYILLLCSTIFAVSLITDNTVTYYEPIIGGWFAEYSGILLVFSLGYILWKDMIEAYQFKLTFNEEKRQLKRQIEIQKSHYLELTNKIEYSVRLKHDQRHHFRILNTLLQNDEIVKATEYLEKYKSENLENERIILCENLIIDAILQFYHSLCKKNNITFLAKMDIPSEIPVSDTNLSLIFGNLLENAYEACTKQMLHSGYIQIQGKMKDNKLYIRFDNAYDGVFKKKSNRFLSTKHNGFGIGIESVKSIIDNYDGIMDIEPSEQCFKVSIILPLHVS